MAMKILIVDDTTMLMALSLKLKSKGHDVLTAQNALEAIKAVESNLVQLVISDLLMPGVSGYELITLLKQFYLRSVPMIIISSLDGYKMAKTALDVGAIDYIQKPIDFKLLYKKIQMLNR